MFSAIRGKVLVTLLLIWGAFIPASLILSRIDLYLMVNALSIVASINVLITYWPAMWLALRIPPEKLKTVDFLTLGIMFAWTAFTARTVEITYARYFWDVHPPELTSLQFAFFQYLAFNGAILHLSARRVIRNSVPVRSTVRVVLTVLVGIILGFVLTTTNHEVKHKPFPQELRGSYGSEIR
jgi:hypothetical protein